MELFDNHNKLFTAAFSLFAGLTLIIAILPAYKNQENNAPLPNAPALSVDAAQGKKIYIENGCVACHTQQVRNVDMDKAWGQRPSIAADYALHTRTDVWRNTATLMGTERTGPDLTNAGERQPGATWHLLHLYQPRAVVNQSIMPAYPWLFQVKDKIAEGDVEVRVPDAYNEHPGKKIVAKKEALQLVAYLQSLKQPALPGSIEALPFLYEKEQKASDAEGTAKPVDGKALYATYCQSCHQANGEGLKGAFPPLKGSPVVLGDNIELFAEIILRGYDAREEYATMPAVGLANDLSAEEIAAIMNHERSSWGNNAKPVSVDEVNKIVQFIKTTYQ